MEFLFPLIHHPHAVRPVPTPVIGVALRRGLVVQDEHVFRIPFLRRFGEIVRTCHGTHDIHYHDLVVHELMLTVIPHPDAMFTQAMPLRFPGTPLVFIKHDPYLDIALPGADEGVGNGFACERVCRNTHGLLCAVYQFNQAAVAVGSRRPQPDAPARQGRERQKRAGKTTQRAYHRISLTRTWGNKKGTENCQKCNHG